jgi:hypothetical protein
LWAIRSAPISFRVNPQTTPCPIARESQPGNFEHPETAGYEVHPRDLPALKAPDRAAAQVPDRCVHRSSRAVSQRPRLKRGSGTTAINENATARPPIPSRLIGE